MTKPMSILDEFNPADSSYSIEQLRDFYLEVFSPPVHEAQQPMFEQVSIFDYSTPTYAAGSTADVIHDA